MVPVFSSRPLHLRIRGARHPLLDSAVPNSITTAGQGLVITGANMAGKSTFMRTVGLAVLLAQTISTATAEGYECSLFRVVSSISRFDDLGTGSSYYYAQCERLLQMIRDTSRELPALCLIDQVLSSTNTVERTAASAALLPYLAGLPLLPVVATHDLDVAARLSETYDTYHFSSEVQPDGLSFTYLTRKGIATGGNAIRLMQQMGYPKEIVGAALRETEGRGAS